MVNQEKLREKQMSMFDDLLDLKCEFDGVRSVIGEMLYFYEFTKEELLAMHFTEEDIDKVIESHDEQSQELKNIFQELA